LTRRQLLLGGAASGALLLALPGRLWARDALPAALQAALRTSPLVYICPLQRDGSESRCHAEVWFVPDGEDLLVTTPPERWRARALATGLVTARLWVGDHGRWDRSGGAFRAAPSTLARGSRDDDPKVRVRALALFGSKYAAEWGKWGPRFRKGLADGSRVLLRYRPIQPRPVQP